MRLALVLALLSGCLVVETSGEPQPAPQTGIEYDCTYGLHFVKMQATVCGPLFQDPDYVIAHFPFENDMSVALECTATSQLCFWFPE